MKGSKYFLFFVVILLFVFALPTIAMSDISKKNTILTLDGPIAIPEVVLIAGTYVFTVDSSYAMPLVRVWNADETEMLTSFFAYPAERLEAAEGTVLTFDERKVGLPEALRTWFYPGDTIGLEFTYAGEDVN